MKLTIRVFCILLFSCVLLKSAFALPWDVPGLNENCGLWTAPKYKRDRAKTAYIQAEKLIAKCKAERCKEINLQYDMSCHNMLEEIPPSISELTYLKIFRSGGAPLKSYMPLSENQNLEVLGVTRHITRLQKIPTLSNLTILGFGPEYGSIDLKGITRFKKLRELQISVSDFSDLSPLRKMWWLEYLIVKKTSVKDLTPLVNAAKEYGDYYNLTSIKIKGTPIAGTDSEDIRFLRSFGISVDDKH